MIVEESSPVLGEGEKEKRNIIFKKRWIDLCFVKGGLFHSP